MYFPQRSEPLELSADRLSGLRLSLNTPVVSIEELPVGPARAGIAIHQEPDGAPSITVGVRSLQSGETVLFSLAGDLQEQSSLAVGIDAALSFGESMGFLFDEDELDAGSTEEARDRALAYWLELMGPARDLEVPSELSPEPPGSEAGGDASPPGPAESEVLLLEEEMAEVEAASTLLEASAEHLEAASGSLPTPAVSPVPLSKFRHCVPGQPESPPAAEAAGASPPARKRTALGRLKLVKRRKTRGGDPSKPSVLQRLLSAF